MASPGNKDSFICFCKMVVNRVFVRSLLMESNKEDLVVVFTRKLFNIEFDRISRKQRFFTRFARWLLIDFDGIT